MSTTQSATRIEDPEAIKREWLDRLEGLVQEVQGWAEAAGWRTRRIAKTVEERQLGKYQVPVLLMEKETVEVVLNPVARLIPGAEGAVDLYLAPAYDDIATLYLEGGVWTVYYCERLDPTSKDGGVKITPRTYGQETILWILDRMRPNA